MDGNGFRLTRRALLKTAVGIGAGVGFIGPWRWARAQAKKPIVIGLTCDATGTFADSGQADRRGMILAIEEFNAKGGVLGRPVEHKWEDTETDASVAVRKAQRLIERDKIDFMIGALSSGVAAPLSDLAQRYGLIYFNSNSSADTVTNEKCQRVNFVWDANNWMFANALAPLVAKNLGTKWFILTHDYVWGKNATGGTRENMKKVGAALALEEIIRIVWGPRGYTVSAPAFVAGPFHWGFLFYSKYRVLVAVLAVLLLVLVWAFLERSPYGAMIKAGAHDHEMVRALGINLTRLRSLVFALGAAMAGVAGVIAAPMWSLKPTVGAEAVMPAFIVVVIGGIGSFSGAVIAGLLLGLTSGLSNLVVPRGSILVMYLLMTTVLLWRPRGLRGQKSMLEL